MNESPYPEVPIAEALAAVLNVLRPLTPVRLGFEAAEGLVLAAEVHASEALPPLPVAAKDGYAVIAADGVAPRRIVADLAAGQASVTKLAPGTAARIATGAPLPDGADAVVMVEETEVVGGQVHVRRAIQAGSDVRPTGQDFAAGEVLLPAGSFLRPAELGLVAAAGISHVSVHPRPQVGVFASGDELVEPGQLPGPGQIRDSNRFVLAAAARDAGATVIASGLLKDTTESIAHLRRAAGTCDAVITSGGVSMGHRDLIKPWLAEHGQVVFGRVRTKPGKPVTFAILDGTPVFALPGFPVSSLVGFELFVRPALRRLAGHPEVLRPRWPVIAGHDLYHAEDRTEYQRGLVTLERGRGVVKTTGFQGSGRLLSFRGANALLELPAGTGFTAAGSTVTALMLELPWANGGEV